MKHDIIIIGINGKIQRNNYFLLEAKEFRRMFNEINNQPLHVSKIFMTQQDYDTIVAWEKNGT
jgi:hypothetical protein